MDSRRRGHSSAVALDSGRGNGTFGTKSSEVTSIIVIAHGTGVAGPAYPLLSSARAPAPGGVEWSVRHVAIQ